MSNNSLNLLEVEPSAPMTIHGQCVLEQDGNLRLEQDYDQTYAVAQLFNTFCNITRGHIDVQRPAFTIVWNVLGAEQRIQIDWDGTSHFEGYEPSTVTRAFMEAFATKLKQKAEQYSD